MTRAAAISLAMPCAAGGGAAAQANVAETSWYADDCHVMTLDFYGDGSFEVVYYMAAGWGRWQQAGANLTLTFDDGRRATAMISGNRITLRDGADTCVLTSE